jgi:hypothetical protein
VHDALSTHGLHKHKFWMHKRAAEVRQLPLIGPGVAGGSSRNGLRPIEQARDDIPIGKRLCRPLEYDVSIEVKVDQ